MGTVKREKKVLDAEWKQTRRGIEWRCHWLELKTLAIQAKLAQYEKVLKKAQGEKVWKWNGEVGEELCSRTVPVKILRNHPIVHHKHRRRAEGGHDVDLGKHPVFSRYGTEGEAGSAFAVGLCDFVSGHRDLASV